jgi:nucleotide-binding universal stress UspA family protein
MAISPIRSNGRPADAVAAGFRSILLPVNTALLELPTDMMDVAARLAAERRSSIVLMAFTEVPLWEEMDVDMPSLDRHVQEMAAEARAIAVRYGVGVHVTAPRTRVAAEQILQEARRRKAELIVLGATGRVRSDFRAVLDDSTARRVSEEAGVRTMFVHAPPAA